MILDIDETILDNSGYQAWMALKGTTFDPKTWNAYVNTVTSLAIPGAVEFAKYAEPEGREGVLHLQPHRRGRAGDAARTSRSRLSARRADRHDADMRASSRTGARRRARAARTSPRTTACCSTSGDNFGDFVDEYRGTEAERLKVMEEHKARWGREWIMLAESDLRLVRVRAVRARLQAVRGEEAHGQARRARRLAGPLRKPP